MRTEQLEQRLPELGTFPVENFNADELARWMAPALWPSPTELYMPRGLPRIAKNGELELGADDVIYYRITALDVPGPEQRMPDRDRRGEPLVGEVDARQLKEIRVRYFFYFENETGEIAHVNDLESAELWALAGLDSTGTRIRVFLWKIFGAAHGLVWATNIADLTLSPALVQKRTWPEWMLYAQSTRCAAIRAARKSPARTEGAAASEPEPSSPACFYKPVLFVEEGKHAVAPDVNGDGFLTTIIDLNASHADAWGIRDSLGTDSRVSPEFKSEMFIPRDLENIRLPEGFNFDRELTPNDLPRLKVEPARTHEACRDFDAYIAAVKTLQQAQLAAVGRKLSRPSLEQLLESKGFCGGTKQLNSHDEPPRGRSKWPRVVVWQQYNPYASFWDGFNLAYRFDRGVGGSFTIPVAISPPYIGGWFIPKANLPFPPGTDYIFKAGQTHRQSLAKSIDLIYMPSASRKTGWYGGGGWEWHRDKDGRTDFETREPGIAWEFGFKLRTVATGGLLWSARLGYRFNGTTRIRDQRFVAEAGVGAW